MADFLDIKWLEPLARRWLAAEAQGRLPHAVLLTGAAGLGKRAAAGWVAERWLGMGAAPPMPAYPAPRPEHADLHWVEPLEGKQGIGIDQVRELVAELELTSYEGRGKVAVIDPADSLNEHAANALLKTLEEPPGNSLLMLVADRIAGLPATIYSRCQRLAVPLPPERAALEWLERLRPGVAWLPVLHAAGGAPLAAVALRERLGETDGMARDLTQIAERGTSPLAVAARWAAQEPDLVLGWLNREVQQCIRRASGAGGGGQAGGVPDSVLERMDTRNLFCYLDAIERLRRRPPGSYDYQLALECLLIDWAGGLSGQRRKAHIAGCGLLPLPG